MIWKLSKCCFAFLNFETIGAESSPKFLHLPGFPFPDSLFCGKGCLLPDTGRFRPGIQVSHSQMPVPALSPAYGCYFFRPGMNVNIPLFYIFNHTGKPLITMRIHPVQRGVCKYFRRSLRSLLFKAFFQKDSYKFLFISSYPFSFIYKKRTVLSDGL